MQDEVMSLVSHAMMEGKEYSASFKDHAYLWLEDPGEFLQRVLTSGTAPSPGELEMQPETLLAPGSPSLQLFQQEVRSRCRALGRHLVPRRTQVPREVPALGCDQLLSAD